MPVPPTAIVHMQAPAAVSVIPTVEATIKNLNRVRRFVASAMNVDLARELGKLAGRDDLTPEARKKTETDLRRRLEIDWGTIPGVNKPFLMQPGAEKFLFWLMLRPQFHKTVIDLGNGHIEMTCYVTVYSKKTGEEVFQGPEASCTTMESNYRFRYTERGENEPIPTQDEAKKLKAAGLGKWVKKDQWVRGKNLGEKWVWFDRTENPNIWDERNKVRQIGEKRALVKAVKNMGALSEIFVASPDEWELGPEEGTEGSPDLDASFTPGGRKIVPDKPVNADVSSYLDRLTPEQRKVEEEALRKAEERLNAQKAPAGQASPQVMHERFDGLTYRMEGPQADDRYRIEGPLVLLEAHAKELRRFWQPRPGAFIVTGPELSDLQYVFKLLKVPFKPHQEAKQL